MKYNFILILSLFSGISGMINLPQAVAQGQDIRFKHISYKEGLFQSPVASVLQDKDGYVWIGNWSGLFRYDGSSFKHFRQNDTVQTAISHNRINKVYEDRNGNLWIGTGGGLNRYDRKTEKFSHVGIVPGKGGGNYIVSLQEDSYGKLWVSTFKGLKFVDEANSKLETVSLWQEQGELGLYEGISFSLCEDKEKTIWVGVKQGLKRVDPKSKKVIDLPQAVQLNKELNAAKVVVIKQDNAGNMWFGSEEHGVFRYNAKDNYCIQYLHKEDDPNSLPSNWINDILIRNNHVWMATRNGLAIFDFKSNLLSNYIHDSADPNSLNDNSVWSLMEDKNGNVWIGTYGGGLNLYYPGISNFNNIGERVGNNIGLNKPIANAIIEDVDGGLWVGTLGGGLNYINRKKGVARYYSVKNVKNGKLSNEVKSIVRDHTGKLWLGTLDGLCVFDKKDETIRYINLEILNSKTTAKLINALLMDEDGIWVGTNGGGLRFITFDYKESKSFVSKPDQENGLSDNYINALLSDGDDLWIATQNGLNRLNKKTNAFHLYRRKNRVGLGNNNVLSLFKDSKHRLWIGTDGGGLNCLDISTGEIYSLNRTHGLVDDVVVSIVEDNSGSIWISTNNGLSQIVIPNDVFPSDAALYKIINYTSANGLTGNQFLANAGLKTSTGEILFGSMNGVTTFYPERIIKNTSVPEILITGFSIKNEEVYAGESSPLQYAINETSHITLPYDDNNITLKFSAVNFIHPEKNVYAYKMSGLPQNDEWTVIGNRKEVNFINLEPGNYVFNIKASNNDGVWNDEGRRITIKILPPLWRTWWAYLLYVIVVFSIVYKTIQFLRIRTKLERDLYNEHLQNERQEEFYKMKLDFFTNISHEIRTPLTLILGPVENLEKNTQGNSLLNRQVLQIKNNAERLLRLIGELLDFRKAETGNMVLHIQKNSFVPFLKEIFLSFQSLAEARGIVYNFIAEKEDRVLYFDKHQLEKVFLNLLANAFKFTDDKGEINVQIVNDSETHITIRITDNGRGIPLEHQHKLFTSFYQVEPNKLQPGTGIGLALSKNIIELHNGTISVESIPATTNKNGKTVFSVRLPLLPQAQKDNFVGDARTVEDAISYPIQNEVDTSVQPVAKLDGRQYSILLAEDNDELRNFMAESLSDYQIISCTNGMEAYKNAIETIPDLIISDVMMPVMNGFELCKKIKVDDRTSHIPVIVLTALTNHIHQVNGLQTGADVYMTKPFSTKLLELNVHNLLSSRDLMRKKFGQQVTLQPHNIPIHSLDEKFIKKLMQIIEDNMEDSEFGVVELGNEIGMSKTVLYKKICALTDLSPADFIKSMRMKRAAFLVQQSTFNVNEIASMVGFNDPKYFSREFKKYHGKSPSEMMPPRQ